MFWELTPYELSLMFEGYALKKEDILREHIYLAWHIEALSRQKRLPKLNKLLRETKKKNKTQKQMSQAELINIAKSKSLNGPW